MNRTKLALLIARREGFYVKGSIPQTHNNPGDLRHSPHSMHTADAPDAIGMIDTVEHGWEDLERELGLYAGRNATLQDLVYAYAPPADANNSAAYLEFVCKGLNCPSATLVSDALKIGGPVITTPKVSAGKVGAVAAGTYLGTLIVGALQYFMSIPVLPTKYADAVIALCVMLAVHFQKDTPSG